MAVLVLLVFGGLLGGIVFLKCNSSDSREKCPVEMPDSLNLPVAKPDTTLEPSLLPASTDSVTSVLADTILGLDHRDPFEAGYEDGYTAGCDDGEADSEGELFDESCNFGTAEAKEKYAEGYREGYEKGFEDGRLGHQFHIQ